MRWPWRRRDVLAGTLIYSSGDSLAALILGQFSLTRLAVLALAGGLLYSLEVPAWFRFIDRRVPPSRRPRVVLARTLLALAYFNPLWIARHLLFIEIGRSAWQAIDLGLLVTASRSFVGNVPLSLLGNALIQNRVPPRWRFFASALFSALMAVYYALSASWFGAS
ncbi:MAG: hypothetical protein H6828_05240 [Planctomycetes bacterium]|nr:hypothetical protein [Planctomycetota bacterium]